MFWLGDVPVHHLVVNFDVPKRFDRQSRADHPDMETYAHRIARCARAGFTGVVINFVQNRKDFDFVTQIAKHWCPKDTSPDRLIPQWVGYEDSHGKYGEDMSGLSEWFENFSRGLSTYEA